MAQRSRLRRRRVLSRSYDAPYGYSVYDPLWGGVMRAAAQAAADVLVGTSRVAGNLIIDASESVFGRRAAALGYGIEDEYEDVEDDEVGDEPATATAAPKAAEVPAVDEEVEYAPPVGICGDLSRAVVDSSRVFSNSVSRFADDVEAGRARRVRVRRYNRRRSAAEDRPAPAKSDPERA